MKLCKGPCGRTLPATRAHFYRSATNIGNLHTWCKECWKARVRMNDYQRVAKRKPDHVRRYGLSAEEYERMVEMQAGLCAICRQPETKKTRRGVQRLSVDHNHKTGAVRKLLCDRCNTALGSFSDDLSLIMRAAEYLRKHAEQEAA